MARADHKSRQDRRRRWWLIGAGLLAIVAAIAACAPLGARATGPRLDQGSYFENPQPIVNDTWAAIGSLFKPDPHVAPESPASTMPVEPGRFATTKDSGLRVKWLGH